MLINLSNHPYEDWPQAQRQAAAGYGAVKDLPFPDIDPSILDAELDWLVAETFARAQLLLAEARREDAEQPCAVLVQGEFVFTYRMVALLHKAGTQALAACSRRVAQEKQEEGTGAVLRTSRYEFVCFRAY